MSKPVDLWLAASLALEQIISGPQAATGAFGSATLWSLLELQTQLTAIVKKFTSAKELLVKQHVLRDDDGKPVYETTPVVTESVDKGGTLSTKTETRNVAAVFADDKAWADCILELLDVIEDCDITPVPFDVLLAARIPLSALTPLMAIGAVLQPENNVAGSGEMAQDLVSQEG